MHVEEAKVNPLEDVLKGRNVLIKMLEFEIEDLKSKLLQAQTLKTEE